MATDSSIVTHAEVVTPSVVNWKLHATELKFAHLAVLGFHISENLEKQYTDCFHQTH
jgi:hypothetical protein